MPETQELTVQQALLKAKKAAKQGKATIALNYFNLVLQQQPDHQAAKNGIHKLQKKSNKLSSKRQLGKQPSSKEVDLVSYLYEKGYMAEAELACIDLLGIYPDSYIVFNFLGTTLQGQDKLNEALQKYDKAIELNPDFAEAHNNRGNVLKYFCRFEDAVASYTRAIELAPNLAALHYNIGHLKKYTLTDPCIKLMESLLLDKKMNVSDQIYLNWALAKAYEDIKQYEKSFVHLSRGNSYHKKEINFTIDKDIEVMSYIKKMFSNKKQSTNVTQDKDSVPKNIFILGMPRSGTSLVEQIISCHSSVHGAGELITMSKLVIPILKEKMTQCLNPIEWILSESEIMRVRDGYLDALKDLDIQENIVTDKMPGNFKWIGFILSAFPHAKIVHLNRDPIATCWSIFKYHFQGEGNSYAYDLHDIVEYYKHYVSLMKFWRKQYPNNIYDISYEDLTKNQEFETRKLLSFCNLDWEGGCLNFHNSKRVVKTISATQVQKKMYTGSSEAWRKYEKQLQPLVDGLNSVYDEV